MSVSLLEAAECSAVYQARKESAAKIAHREKIIEYFQKRMDELGIQILVGGIVRLRMSASTFQLHKMYQDHITFNFKALLRMLHKAQANWLRCSLSTIQLHLEDDFEMFFSAAIIGKVLGSRHNVNFEDA